MSRTPSRQHPRQLRFDALSGRSGNFHAASQKMRPRYRSLPHWHDFHEFFLVVSGEGLHHVNTQIQPLRPGLLTFIRPADRHWFSTRRHPLEIVNLAFPASWWNAYLSLRNPHPDRSSHDSNPGLSSSTPQPPSILLNPAAARDCLAHFRALIDPGAHSPCALLETCLALDRAFSPPAPADLPATIPQWLQTLRQDMSDESLLPNPIPFWHDRSGRSPEHLARTCRRHFGATLTELLNRARIQFVQRRLRDSDAKTSAIALAAGFNNLGYFYRIFRRECGATPRQWLRGAATIPEPRPKKT